MEKATGLELVVDRNNAGEGAVDLADGKCDAALASAGLETVVGAARAAGREVDIAKLQFAVIKSDQIVFVVNAANPVKSLTHAQIRDIHTGKVANWKEVGGADLPIVVVTDIASSATRGLIKQAVLKARTSAKRRSKVATKVPAAPEIGGLGAGFVKAGVAVVQTEKVERPLGLVTMGARRMSRSA